jgi:para-nitrobenzyl esterase
MSTVNCGSGKVLGALEGGLHAFKGIPYAEPVGGAARWRAPVPRKPWKDVLNARQYGPAALQFSARPPLRFPTARHRYLETIRGSVNQGDGDDCLLLNVWTSSIDAGARLPVMLYIHGGSFTSGAANGFYDASRFARNGVVSVVIQYRLGAAGFLHGSSLFGDGVCADNRGLLDQICALEWVRDNIAAFGGDPAQVTVFGESAGAFAIYQLAASPLAKGLFKRGIAMGGMAGTWAPADEYHALTRDVLSAVGVAPGDAAALAALGREQIGKMQTTLQALVFRAKDPERYGSITRTRVPFLGAAVGGAFLPQPPLPTYRSGTPNNIELMLGTCRNDGGLFSLGLPLPPALNARLFSKFLSGLVPNRDMAAARGFYAEQLSGLQSQRVQERVNNDAFYLMPTLRAAEAHAEGHPGKTYHYRLDHASSIPGLGAIHGIDVALLFRTPQVDRLLRAGERMEALSESMMQAWTTFARDGKPAAPSLPRWQPFDARSRATMVLDDSSRLELDPEPQLRRFWEALPAA